MSHVVFVCTGNAVRSVIAGAIWARLLPSWQVTTAGTHVIEGQPISRRTHDALARLDLAVRGHRSRQLQASDLASADLVVGFEVWHIEYIRRTHPEVDTRAATLKRWCRDLSGTSGPLAERVAALDLGHASLGPWEEINDPAGGDIEVVAACAEELHRLLTLLAGLIGV